ncbi:MAG: gliding motility-associated ABC transporter ATP-binding subunit GldA [Chitinophagaceae bacterium]|jgi:ABC-2 type transport system ATP-binding protein|nr:gliding motility-associated ABC transporter ATP-binding subunit GldA [Chitinophagaceae bacterium]MCE2974538.1 gliding motility-associated ABC transporter ATP-binding subunit GldA [Sediminibacterium sp.]
MSIRVEGIQKRYGNQQAVGNVSFELQRGEIVGFLGPNGAGKSTTLKMITGYVQPDAGNIQVEGLSVAEHPLEVRKKIGYLPEANPLYYDMYVREYLQFIAGVHHLPAPEKAINQVIEMTGLTREAHKKCGQLSKGYKQRVGLAAALVHNPPVLILDEPTSGLDPNQIVEIREVIRKQGADKTILFSSHILQEVEAICDRVIILHQGKVVADNRIRQLQQEENSAQVLEVQLREEVAEQEWREVPGVQQLIAMGGGRYRISTQDAEQLSRALMQWTVQKGYTLLSFQREESSLEDVFRQLTSQQP